jgi:hypothetical protein
MESVGVYWKPVFDLLEAHELELLLVNARHMEAVPSRKSDVKDSQWIAALLRQGLLHASFVPERPQRELHELTRYRRRLIEQRASPLRHIEFLEEEIARLDAGSCDSVPTRSCSIASTRSRASRAPAASRSSPRSQPTRAASSARSTSPHGRGSAPATTRAPASVRVAAAPRGATSPACTTSSAAQRAKKRAAVAVATAIFITIYHMIARGTR